MFGYKYIVSVVLLLSSLFSLNAAFAEESQSTVIIPKIETYMWNDALVVSLQGNSVNNEFTSKRYDIEYIQVPETSKDSDIKELSPQYSPIDTYKIIGDTHYSILPRPQIGKIYSFHVFLLGEDGITRIAYAIFDVKIPQYSLKKSGKITFTKAIRTNVIPHVMNRDFASALGFPLSWDLSANGIVRMSSLTQSSGAVLPLGTQFIINPLFHWINGPLSFAFQQEYQYANNWIVQKTANIVHDIVLSAAPVAQNNTTTSTPVSSSSTPTPVSSSSSSSSSSSGTPPPTNTGSANTSSTNTGSTNTGSTNTGSTSTGSTNTGSTSTGSTSTGSTSTGSTNTGSTSTGSSNTGSTTPPPPPTNYTLSIVPTGSGTISSSPAGISCGTSGSSCSAIFLSGTIVTLTQTTDSGSTFSGWNGACTGTGSCIVNMTQAQTVGASFTLIPPPPPPPTNYTLFVFPTGSGTISSSPAGISCGTSGSTCSTSFLSGTLITLTPVADSGSTFSGWNGACTGTGSCIVNMTSDRAVGATFALSCPNCFKKRYIWYMGNIARYALTADASYNKLVGLIKRAKLAGYNGIVIDAGGSGDFVHMITGIYHSEFYPNYASIMSIAQAEGIELIPVGGRPNASNFIQNEAIIEAFPVDRSPFLVSGMQANQINTEILTNTGFENGTTGWTLMEATRISMDNTVSHNGINSVKFTSTGIGSMTRLYRQFSLQPHKAYRLSFWAKTQNYNAPLKIQIYDPTTTELIYGHSNSNLGWGTTNGSWNGSANTLSGTTQDWTQYSIDFNTLNYSGARLYLGTWSNGSLTGSAWVDDFSLQEIGLEHTVRRASLPVIVQSQDELTTYSEGGDYVVGTGKIILSSGSTIPDGSQLKISWYQSAKHIESQYGTPSSACYQSYFDDQKAVSAATNTLFNNPKGFFLYIDEWRIMNWDPFCGMITAGEYLKNTIKKTQDTLLEINPNYEMYVWNDMIDPFHNATGAYMMSNGDMSGSWLGLNPNTTVMNWNPRNSAMQVNSLKFFSDLGLKQMIALYYDDSSLTSTTQWMESLNTAEQQGVVGVDGFMYTTWNGGNGNYNDLEAVANLIKTNYPDRWPDAITPVSRTLSITPIISGTVTSSPAGISCGILGSSCSQVFSTGTLVTLTPVADSGYTFSGWNGSCTGTGSCTVNMNNDQTVGATFSVTPPILMEVEVYSGASFSGQKTVYTSGVYINTGSFLFSSFRVPSQKIVRLCEIGSQYGAGNCKTLTEGNYSILPSELSKVEYLEIQDTSQYQKFLAQGTFDSDMDIKGPDGVIYPNFTFAGKKLPFPASYHTTLDVTTYGADGTDLLDDAVAINSALTFAATLTGQSVLVRIPAGTYYLDDTVNIGRSNITLQGDGEGITNIVPRFDGHTLSENPNVDTGSIKYAIDIAPASSATWHSLAYVLTGSVSRGTRVLNFASGAHSMVCEVGRILNINAKTPQRIVDQLNSGEQTLLANDTWYNYGYAVQYAQVIAANTSGGCNQVTLDRPIYEDLQESPTISIGTQGSMISEVGVEQLSIRQDNNVKGINAFRFFKSTESWMRNIHVERIGNWMYSIDRSIDFTVKDSTFENVLVYGGGGQGYGISTQNTNDGLFDNIIYKHMRHVIPHGSNMVYHRISLEDVDFNLHSAFPRQILLDNSQIIAKTTTGSGHGQYGMGIWSVDTFSDTIHTPVGKRIIAFHNTIESAVESVFMGGGDTRNWVIAYNAFAGSKGAAISIRPGADNNIFYKNTFIQKNYQLTGWYNGYPYFPTAETATGAVVFLSNSIPPLHNQFSENLFFGIPDVTKMFVGTPYITSSSAVESNTFDINPNPVSVPDQIPFTNSGSLYEWQLINYPR